MSPSMMSTVDKDAPGDIVDRTETAFNHLSTVSADNREKQTTTAK